MKNRFQVGVVELGAFEGSQPPAQLEDAAEGFQLLNTRTRGISIMWLIVFETTSGLQIGHV